MTHRRRRPGHEDEAARAAESELRRDLDAWRESSRRDVPTLQYSLGALRRARSSDNPGGILMNSFRWMKARPWPASLAVAAVVAVALIFIPVSFQKTVGFEVTIGLGKANLAPEQIKSLAGELRGVLGAERIAVTMENEGAALTAQVPRGSLASVQRTSEAFADALNRRGFAASSSVSPKVERVVRNLYAYAVDNIIEIRIDREGKSAEQIAEEIRAQLEAAGLRNPSVEYSEQDGRTELRVNVERELEGDESMTEPPTDIRIKIDGVDTEDPQEQKHVIRVRREPGMTDEQVLEDVRRQMREQGMEGDAVIENGRVKIIHPER